MQHKTVNCHVGKVFPCAKLSNVGLLGTFCGVFRRQALDRGAMSLKVDKIVTGELFLFGYRI